MLCLIWEWQTILIYTCRVSKKELKTIEIIYSLNFNARTLSQHKDYWLNTKSRLYLWKTKPEKITSGEPTQKNQLISSPLGSASVRQCVFFVLVHQNVKYSGFTLDRYKCYIQLNIWSMAKMRELLTGCVWSSKICPGIQILTIDNFNWFRFFGHPVHKVCFNRWYIEHLKRSRNSATCNK